MSDTRRYYRKLLASTGLIFLAGHELEITVKNFSVTGILVQLLENPVIKDVGDLFKAIESSPLIDMYLQELRLAGEVSLVRADMLDDGILLALEFVHIAYDIEAVFYKRKVYRKTLEALGRIVLHERKHVFKTINVSVEGLMVYLDEKVSVTPGLVTAFEFDHFNLIGEVEVKWVEDDPNGGTLMGLRYQHIETEKVKGIPRFEQAVA